MDFQFTCRLVSLSAMLVVHVTAFLIVKT